jgi:hypothetical protein
VIKSNYISNILNQLLDHDKDGLFARQQIPFLTDLNFEYTGSGLFVSFDHTIGIERYKTENQNLVLDGVKITSDEYQIEAQAILFFKDGLIDNLEIWCYKGDYPKSDPTSYVLAQTWTVQKRNKNDI